MKSFQRSFLNGKHQRHSQQQRPGPDRNLVKALAPSAVHQMKNTQGTLIGSVVDYNTKPTAKCNRAPLTLPPGTIIWAPYVAPSLDANAHSDNRNFTISELVGPIVAKARPYIIIGCLYKYGVVAIPIYSSAGKGVMTVPLHKRGECVLLLKHNEAEKPVAGIINGTPLRTVPGCAFAPKFGSYAKTSECTMIPFEYPIGLQGAVDQQSVQVLRTWFKRFFEASFLEQRAQERLLASFVPQAQVFAGQSTAHKPNEQTYPPRGPAGQTASAGGLVQNPGRKIVQQASISS